MDPRINRQNISIPRIRVLSLGNCGVGKSCLIKRYCEQRFVQRYLPTIGIDYGSTTVDVEGRRVSVHFFDTSGSPLFEEVRTEFYPDMQGVMLVYDVTDRASFTALDHWMGELRHNLGQPLPPVLVVVGTRSDTSGSTNGRQVSESDGAAWAARHSARHVVTSAALGTGVTQAFVTLFSAALQTKEGFVPPPEPPSFANTTKPTPGGGGGATKAGNKQPTTGTKQPTTNTGTKPAPGRTTAAPPNVNKPAAADNKQTNGSASKQNGESDALTAIHRLLHSTDNCAKMNVSRRGLTKEEVNKAYRRLAGLVHPDKCRAEGAEEAFKALAQARTAVLSLLTETTV